MQDMALTLPTSRAELADLAEELSSVVDALAAGSIDGGASLERFLISAIEEVEQALADADAVPDSR
jgi:hypothetical protein